MVQLTDVFKAYENGSKAIRGISLTIQDGEFVFLVGPSGSGKSTIVKLITGEIAPTDGTVLVNGFNLTTMKFSKMPYMRRTLVVIFQDFRLIENKSVYENVAFAMRVIGASNKEIKHRVPYVLSLVGLEGKEQRHPQELSGGEQQRVAVARALVNDPQMIIADEPTTALDVTIQAQVLAMIENLKERFGTSMILITHDLGIVAQMCDRVAIMYAGKIIETGTVKDIFSKEMRHPYTEGLFGSLPNLETKSSRLHPIDGLMPDPANLPTGCKFYPRCPHCMPICKENEPTNITSGTHIVACHLYDSEKEKR